MGRIEEVSFDLILPGQDGYSNEILASLLKINDFTSLTPIPAREINGKFVHLDGRHRLLAQYLQGKKNMALYIPSRHDDFLQTLQAPQLDYKLHRMQNMNQWLRWEVAIEDMQRIGVENYHEHVRNLHKKFPQLGNLITNS